MNRMGIRPVLGRLIACLVGGCRTCIVGGCCRFESSRAGSVFAGHRCAARRHSGFLRSKDGRVGDGSRGPRGVKSERRDSGTRGGRGGRKGERADGKKGAADVARGRRDAAGRDGERIRGVLVLHPKRSRVDGVVRRCRYPEGGCREGQRDGSLGRGRNTRREGASLPGFHASNEEQADRARGALARCPGPKYVRTCPTLSARTTPPLHHPPPVTDPSPRPGQMEPRQALGKYWAVMEVGFAVGKLTVSLMAFLSCLLLLALLAQLAHLTHLAHLSHWAAFLARFLHPIVPANSAAQQDRQRDRLHPWASPAPRIPHLSIHIHNSTCGN